MYCTIAKTDREYYWPRVNCFFFFCTSFSLRSAYESALKSEVDGWFRCPADAARKNCYRIWIYGERDSTALWCNSTRMPHGYGVCVPLEQPRFFHQLLFMFCWFLRFFFYAWKKEIRIVSSRGHWVSCLLLFFAAAAAVFCLLPYVIQRCAICNCCMHRHAWVCPTTVSTLRSASTTVDERLVFAHRHLNFCCCCCCQFATVQARRTLSAADRVQLFST